MFISYIASLPVDNEQADAVVIGISIKPLPVRDKVRQLDVVSIITNLSNDFNIVVDVL